MGRYIDLTGMRFGRLVAMYRSKKDCAVTIWHCVCDCGKEVDVRAGHLRNGHTQSCGCMHREMVTENNRKHDMSKTRLYTIWSNMKSRCMDPKNPKYKSYGGRDIKVCDEWLDSTVFFQWALSNGYRDDLTIDRIDVNGDYEPDNCRWVGTKEQSLNRTDNHYLTYHGITQTMKEWSDAVGIKYSVLEARINRYHWDVTRALETA